MEASAERLEEIDRELEAFGKTDDELAAVAARAVALARSLSDADGDLSSLLDGREEALAAARDVARQQVSAAVQDAAPPRARPEPPAPPKRAVPPPPPSLPHQESAAALNDEIDEAFGSEPPPLETSDIAGMSVDELFADADPSPSMPPQDLASLFDDEDEDEDDSEALRLSDPDLAVDEIEVPALEEPAAEQPVAEQPPVEAAAEEPPAEEPAEVAAAAEPQAESVPLDDFPLFGEEDDATQIVQAEDLEELSGDDFELLVDEDILEFDSEDEAEAPAEGEGEGGLISRILSRK